MKKCVFTSDLHGNKRQYAKLKKFIFDKKIDVLLLGGDLFPKDGGLWEPGHKTRTIESQKEFIVDFFLPFLTEIGKACKTYFIFGNDDFADNLRLFKTTPENSFLINNKLEKIDKNLFIYGYPYVVLTPFLQKDWEKWDIGNRIDQKKFITAGYLSKNNRYFPIDFNKTKYLNSSITNDLKKISQKIIVKQTIFLMHEAPFDTNLDQVAKDNPYIANNNFNIGSKAVRKFIETESPYLTLHGHIHETVEQSGNYFQKINNTLAIASGNDFKKPRLRLVIFDLKNPANKEIVNC